MNDRIRETHQLVESRFGKQFGENKESTMEDMLNFASEIVENYSESKRMLEKVFLELRALEEKVMPKRMDLDRFPENKAEDLDAKCKNLISTEVQFESGSDTGVDRLSTDAFSKRRYSIKSEPGDIKERTNKTLRPMSKSTSQIVVRERLRKDRGAGKKGSKGRHIFTLQFWGRGCIKLSTILFNYPKSS